MALSPPKASNAGLWARQAALKRNSGFHRHPADRDGLYPDDTPEDALRVWQHRRRHRLIMNSWLFQSSKSCWAPCSIPRRKARSFISTKNTGTRIRT